MKTLSKYLLTSSIIAILTITLFGTYAIKQYHVNEVGEVHEQLETALKTFRQLLAHKGAEFRVANGQLLVGDYRVNGNFEVPDKVQEIFGGVATVFMGDERVATNVQTAAGQRAVGTRLVGPAHDAIFKQGQPYRGAADILGVRYVTAYDPIRDPSGRIIGALFVGVKESDFLAPLERLQMHLLLTLLGMVAIFAVFMVLLGRAMKRADDGSKSAYQQLLDIVEFLPDATFVLDKERRVIAWNRAIELLTGVEKRDIMGKGDYAYAIPFYNDQRPLLINLLDEEEERRRLNYTDIKREGHTLLTEVYVPAFRNGGSRYFWATATPLFDQEGNRVGGIESIRDITEYKLAEAERSHLVSQLHHARMMETFMTRLGHDLRTPLTPLFVLFPLIKRRITDPELQGMVDICCKSATSMKKLVDKAQLLVRLSATTTKDDLEPVALATEVARAIADCSDSMVRKHVVCRNEIDPLLVVNAVRDQLQELFANLLGNATRFSAENGVIRITAHREGETVTVAVHDDGIGLHPDHLERIFDEFFKADDSRHDLDAPGLGLSICKRIVFNHGGRIWAASPGLGKGTTITFTINENAVHCGDNAKESN